MNERGKGVHQNTFNTLLNAKRKRRIKEKVSSEIEPQLDSTSTLLRKKSSLSFFSSPSDCLHLEDFIFWRQNKQQLHCLSTHSLFLTLLKFLSKKLLLSSLTISTKSSSPTALCRQCSLIASGPDLALPHFPLSLMNRVGNSQRTESGSNTP